MSGKVSGTGNDIGGVVGYQNGNSYTTSAYVKDIEVIGSEGAGFRFQVSDFK